MCATILIHKARYARWHNSDIIILVIANCFVTGFEVCSVGGNHTPRLASRSKRVWGESMKPRGEPSTIIFPCEHVVKLTFKFLQYLPIDTCGFPPGVVELLFGEGGG